MNVLARLGRFACCLLALGGMWARPALGQPARIQFPPVTQPGGMANQVPTAMNAPPPTMVSVTATVDLFNPREVKLSWHDRRWVLVHQGQTLKDFGSRVADARQALRLIQDLGLNQRGVIGSPVPHLEYWLVDGHAPGALPRSGMHTIAIEPDRLRIEQVHQQWCIRDGNRVLFNFAQYADEAREALAVLQKHHFTQVSIVGQVSPTMMVFGGQGQGDAPTMAATHGPSAMGRQFAPQKFPRLVKNSDGSPRFEQLKTTSTPTAPGYEGIVQPLVPPLFTPTTARASGSGEMPTLANQRAVAWHKSSRLGSAQPAQATEQGQEERHAFDWRQAQIRQDDGEWKLTAGSLVLATFGPNLHQAQMALAAVRHYRFQEQRTLAGDAPLAYFLANAAVPRGLMLGMQGSEFQPEKLDVQHLDAGYAICQGPRVVLQFRERPEPARQALEAIQRQKLDCLYHVGDQGKGGMTLVLKSQ